MKKFLFLICLAMLCNGVVAQEKNKEAKTDKIFNLNGVIEDISNHFRTHRKYASVTASTGISSYNQFMAMTRVEYTLHLKHRWYIGALAQANIGLGRLSTYDYDSSLGGVNPYNNTVYQNIYALSAMAYYKITVFDGFLYLRFGAGLGLGYHQIKDNAENPANFPTKDKVLPYFNGEICWLFAISKRLDLKLAPTLFMCPSQFAYSPTKLAAPTTATNYYTDLGFSIGVGIIL